MFHYQIALLVCDAVRYRTRHADSVRRSDCVQSLRFGDEHRKMLDIVELEEIARIVRSLQTISLVDAAAPDGCRAAHLERTIRAISSSSTMSNIFRCSSPKRRD